MAHSSPPLEIELGFDELQLPDFGIGMLLYGTAYLQSTGDGEFWVQSIKLDNGAWLHPARESGTMSARLYREISAVLYDETTPYGAMAAEVWGEAWSDCRLPDPDRAYDERRDQQAMGFMA